jgi:type VII secretion integral membrane protein EccD
VTADSIADEVAGGLCRVRVTGPRARVDLALPIDIPLAEMLPDLLDWTGTDEATSGWIVTKLDGVELDIGRPVGELGIYDAEELLLTRVSELPRVVIHDDVVDAVAAAASARTDRWSVGATRAVTLAAAVAALGGGSVVVVLSGRHTTAAAVSLGIALALIFVTMILHRALADQAAAIGVALAAIGYGGIGGLLITLGAHPLHQVAPRHVLLAALVMAAFAMAVSVGVAGSRRWCMAPLAGAVALAIGALLCRYIGCTPGQASAIVLGLGMATFPALPGLAIRLGGLPMPAVPVSAAEVMAASTTDTAADLAAATDRVQGVFAGLIAAVSLVSVGSAAVLTLGDGSPPAQALVGVASILLLILSRGLMTVPQRLPAVAGGASGLALLAAGLTYHPSPDKRQWTRGLPLLLAVHYTLRRLMAVRGYSPYIHRAGDLLTGLLAIALVALVGWSSGLYALVGTLAH